MEIIIFIFDYSEYNFKIIRLSNNKYIQVGMYAYVN